MNATRTTKARRRTEKQGTKQSCFSILLIIFLLSGILSNPAATASPDEENIYLNPVIFIPGTMGSRLVDRETGLIVWGKFSRRDANGKTLEATRGIALPMMPGKSLREIRDSVTEDGMLNDLQFAVFQSLELSAPYYQGILDKITGKPRSGIGKWRSSRISTPNRTCYEFSYDWRRSCDENAVRLAALVEKETRLIEAKRRAAGSSRPVRFDIVAHSQGALLARYYLRYGGQSLPENGELPDLNWAGADHIDNVVLMGAPNAGVTKTLKFLTHGHKHHTVLPYYEPAVIGTMPSIYQMLPRAGDQVLIAPKTGAVLDPLDFDLWLEKEWGLANPKQDKELAKLLPHVKDPGERRLIALDHLRKCLDSARQFQAALDVPSYRPNHLHMVMCACDSKQTPVRFLAQRYEVRVHQRTKGDGMVSFRSASRCLSPCLRNGIQGPSWDAFRVFKTNHDKMAMKSKVSEFVLMALSPR